MTLRAFLPFFVPAESTLHSLRRLVCESAISTGMTVVGEGGHHVPRLEHRLRTFGSVRVLNQLARRNLVNTLF